MDISTASLAFTDGSQLSITESETASSRHGYNTRYSAKLKSPQPSNAALVPDAASRVSERTKKRTDATPHRPKSVIEQSARSLTRIIDESTIDGNCVDVTMRRNYCNPICSQPICTKWERICRYAIMFFAIGSVVLICSYLGRSLSESQGSVDCVRKELKKFKRDMTDLKEEVQDIIANRDQTNKKLEIIQELLTDLKSNHDKISELKEQCEKRSSDMDLDSQKAPSDITKALNKYDADKTGKTDFALESAGGSIVGIGKTENYPAGDTVKFFGISLCPASNGPRAMIQPGTLPGECWAFKGSKGTAVIQLLGNVRISSVSLEHIQKTMSPSGEISTAPKEFSIWGLKSAKDEEGTQLGQYTYNANGPPIQEFKVQSSQNAYNFIEFRVHSNNGNPDFTCVYRLRVHGRLEGK